MTMSDDDKPEDDQPVCFDYDNMEVAKFCGQLQSRRVPGNFRLRVSDGKEFYSIWQIRVSDEDRTVTLVLK
jgi:hypothetical protein